MKWFGPFSITWWPCVLTAMLAACTIIVRWINYGVSTDDAAQNYAELFSHLSQFMGEGSTPLLVLIVTVTGVGAMLSVVKGDRIKNAACKQACQRAGWRSGRYRGDPHRSSKHPVTACWCCEGNNWATEPLTEQSIHEKDGQH